MRDWHVAVCVLLLCGWVGMALAGEEPITLTVRPRIGMAPLDVRVTVRVRDDQVGMRVDALCGEDSLRGSGWQREPGDRRFSQMMWTLGEPCDYVIVARSSDAKGATAAASIGVEVR